MSEWNEVFSMIVPVMAISNLVLTQQIYSEETNGAHAHNRDRVQQEWQKSSRFSLEKNQLYTCIKHFFTCLRLWCTATKWNFLFSRFLEDVNTIRQQFSFPEIRYSPQNSTPEKFAIICPVQRDGINAIKFEAARILFLRAIIFVAVFVVVA